MDRETAERILRNTEYWHYPFDLPWGRTVPNKAGHDQRHFQRRRHFFAPLLEIYGGSFEGRSVLDLGCCQGFWSFECAKAGAAVLGIDSSEAFIEEAVALQTVLGIDRCEFLLSHLEEEAWWAKTGKRAITLFLGLFYHLTDPVFVLRKAMEKTTETIIVDTEVMAAEGHLLFIKSRDLVEPTTRKSNLSSKLRVVPSVGAVVELLKDGGFETTVLPVQGDAPGDYLSGTRVSVIGRRKGDR